MTPCPRCHGRKETWVAGNRIARPCPSCDGKGYHDPDEAMLDAEGRTIAKLEHANRELRRANEELELEALQLRAIKGDYEKRIRELEAKARNLDTEASHLRSAFTKAHVGHDCEGRPCWMRETYERSLKRAEADEKRERAAGKHANCPDNPCPRIFPYCEDTTEAA